MVMASLCFITGQITGNYNGLEMNEMFGICRNRNFDSFGKDYLFNSQKPFDLHLKRYFKSHLYFPIRTCRTNENETERKVVNDMPDVTSTNEKWFPNNVEERKTSETPNGISEFLN